MEAISKKIFQVNKKKVVLNEYHITKAEILMEYLHKYKIKHQPHPTIPNLVRIFIEPNYFQDEIFWFGVDYGMWANKQPIKKLPRFE